LNIIISLSEYVTSKLARTTTYLNSDPNHDINSEMSPEEFEKRLARANKILGYELINTKLSNT
jgi:hypothetical protein